MYLYIGLVTMEAFSLVEEHLFLNQIKQFIVLREGRRGIMERDMQSSESSTEPSLVFLAVCAVELFLPS